MEIKAENIRAEKTQSDILFIFAFEDQKKPFLQFLKNETFKGEKSEQLTINTQEKLPSSRIIFLGLGKSKDLNLDVVRNASALGARKALKLKAKKIAVDISSLIGLNIADAAQAVAEGVILGSYKFKGYHKKHEDEQKITSLQILTLSHAKEAAAGAKIGSIISKAENRARDLVNTPSNKATPEFMALYCVKLARQYGLKCTILNPQKEGMECIWGVAKGSKRLPKVVLLRHNGAAKSDLIGLIGKGITFDSGGISLKPSNKMWEMRHDMAGAAAVIEAMSAISELKLPQNIIAVVPLTENMPDGGALKPGDVIGSLDGTTVEIISTDAEGRLILADAVTYAKKLGAAKIFDCATLTGGCITALGDAASAIIGNNHDLIKEIEEASKKSGQKVWQMPLFEEYKEYLKSTVADIKNCMDRGMASPSTGAVFIERFVGETPWVHMDIAGTAALDRARPPYFEGPTGVPLRTIIEWLRK